MKHELRRRCVRWLEKHWKQHEPEEHHLYLYDRNETVAVPEFHTITWPSRRSIFPTKNKQNKNAIVL